MGSAVVFAIAAAACVDLSAPKDAPASISPVQAGALFAVQGDVIRDTLGNPSVLSIISYDGAGNPVSGFTPSFFIIDTIANAKLNADGTLSGTRIGTNRLIGQIGNVQTPPLPIFITTTPTTLSRVGSGKDSVAAPGSSDSASAIGSATLQVGVRGPANEAIGGMFVRFEIKKTLESKPGTLAVYLQDDINHTFGPNISTPDTTDASGNASRKLVVNSAMLANPSRVSGTSRDTVIVEVTAKYRGQLLGGSPLRIPVPINIFFPR